MTEGENKVLHDVYRILNYNIQPLLIKISEIFKNDFCPARLGKYPTVRRRDFGRHRFYEHVCPSVLGGTR